MTCLMTTILNEVGGSRLQSRVFAAQWAATARREAEVHRTLSTLDGGIGRSADNGVRIMLVVRTYELLRASL